MNKLTLAIIALAALAGAAHADQAVTDKHQKNFKACVVANGLILGDLKDRGFEGEVLVHTANSYIAKVKVPGDGASALLTCEGGHQQVVIIDGK